MLARSAQVLVVLLALLPAVEPPAGTAGEHAPAAAPRGERVPGTGGDPVRGVPVLATSPDTARATVVFVVRHAEKDTALRDDPPLTAAGRARAQLLARTLAGAGVTRVFSTPTRRTRDTAAPLAAAIGDSVRLVGPTALLLERLAALAPGERALVVGHSNTVPEIVSALGGAATPIADHEYDRLYVVTRTPGRPAAVLLLHYGAATTRPAPAGSR